MNLVKKKTNDSLLMYLLIIFDQPNEPLIMTSRSNVSDNGDCTAKPWILDLVYLAMGIPLLSTMYLQGGGKLSPCNGNRMYLEVWILDLVVRIPMPSAAYPGGFAPIIATAYNSK